LHNTSDVLNRNNTVIKTVLYTADVLLELGQEVYCEGLSGTEKTNT
jgi:hypothetical protein